jgi:hypothetical protein
MATTFSINSGCQPLLNAGTCVSVEDLYGDAHADVITTRFTGEDGHQYELQAQTRPFVGEWGPGSEFTLTDRTFQQPGVVLAHYRVSGNYALEPLDIGTTECRALPTPVQRDGEVGSSIPMPNGQQAFVAIRSDARAPGPRLEDAQATWVKLGVISSSGQMTLQVTSQEGYAQHVFAIELDDGKPRQEARFVPRPLYPAL